MSTPGENLDDLGSAGVTLRLHDSRSRTVRDFVPLEPGRVTMYVCGPTVQAPPHVGHARSAVAFDILRRWLAHRGFDVVFARNITDIDDKIIHDAGHEHIPWWALAQRNTVAFEQAFEALNVLPPTVEPRATGHVTEMVTLIERLIAAGHAYASGGGVYFDVRSFPAYGALSGQDPDAMLAAEKADAGTPVKRDPLDFALWKAAKPGEPTWPTPWGEGRPGWHLECSAMSTRYLGPTFDIHGGGIDLIFPHHENEVAQSEAAGDGFARYWLHHGLVNVGAEKMSKSLGNSLRVSELLEQVRPAVLRYYLGSPHYRSPLDWTEEGLAEAESAYARIEGFLGRAAEIVGGAEPGGGPSAEPGSGPSNGPGDVPAGFSDALDDDLGVPQALAALHVTVRAGNALLAGGTDKEALAARYREVRAMVGVLGLDPADPAWGERRDAGHLHQVIERLVGVTLEERAAARGRGDYASADRIRAGLGAAGIAVEDTPSGPRWSVADPAGPT